MVAKVFPAINTTNTVRILNQKIDPIFGIPTNHQVTQEYTAAIINMNGIVTAIDAMV